MVATGTLKRAEASLGFKSVFCMGLLLFIPLLSTMPRPKSQGFRGGFCLAGTAAALCQPGVTSIAHKPCRDEPQRTADHTSIVSFGDFGHPGS